MSHPTLTPAQAERLEMLAEEAAEVVQCCTKILRHGYDSYHPDDVDGKSNRDYLVAEVKEVTAVAVGLMHQAGDLNLNTTDREMELLVKRKLKYTHHQGE